MCEFLERTFFSSSGNHFCTSCKFSFIQSNLLGTFLKKRNTLIWIILFQYVFRTIFIVQRLALLCVKWKWKMFNHLNYETFERLYFCWYLSILQKEFTNKFQTREFWRREWSYKKKFPDQYRETRSILLSNLLSKHKSKIWIIICLYKILSIL